MSTSLSKTPAPKKDKIYGSKVNPKGSASSEKSAKSIKLSGDIIVALTNKLKEFKEKHPNSKNIGMADLKAVYRRGLGAYSTSHRPNITRNAWAMARVNKFLLKAGGTKVKAAYVQDDDLMKFKDGGEVKEYYQRTYADGTIQKISIEDYEKNVLPNLGNGGEVDDHKETYAKWKSLVNMSKSELEKFYNSEEGKVAGLKPSEAKAQGIDSGRESARWIMKMKDTPTSEWTPQMWKWAKKQISFISRMSGNKGGLYDDKGRKTRKHLSLLIWGNNPEKKNSGGVIRKEDIEEIKEELKQGQVFENNYAQFLMRKDGVMFRYDLTNGKYKFYNDIDAFARAIFRFRNRGYEDGGMMDIRMEDTVGRIDDPRLTDISYYNNGGTINKNINFMEQNKFASLPHIDTINNGDKVILHEQVFSGDLEKPKHIGSRYIVCEVMGRGGMTNSLNLKVAKSVGTNAINVGSTISRPISVVLAKGKKYLIEPIANKVNSFKDGGELNPDNKQVKQFFAHDSGNAGGVLVGKRHSEGGIKAINKSTGQPIEMEGGEVVITRGAVSNPKKYSFNGKEMTTREVLSKLNVDGGGVSFAEGGDVPDKINCGCSHMDLGGTTMTPQDFIRMSEKEYEENRLIVGIEKERKDHFYTLAKLNAGAITIEQALKEIAIKEMMLDANYPFGE
jgi:hypothetical protein